jgi:nicotinate-nucleotide adenylyltransferase
MKIRFMPALEQPFKGTAHEATPAQRAAMLELAVADNPRFGVERIELELPPPSYTVRTLRALAAREPGNRFTLLLGADAARDLASWFEVEALPGLGDVVTFARAGQAPLSHPLVRRVVAVPAVDVSATEIRRRVRARQSIRYLVPEAVRTYIAGLGLYR